ncbi:MAG: hypothetical protein M1814_000300 [Vezdaea aestivalis]|nr:MAG: hypothetical protein M1814_000300 [Vezdaea aestivalis]
MSLRSRIFALGSNGSGQLGTGLKEDHSIPTQVIFPHHSPPRQISGGGNHTLILCEDGTVWYAGQRWVFGDDAEPRPVTGFTQLTDIFPKGRIVPKEHLPGKYKICSATWEASILVDCDDTVNVVGKGLKGELGLGEGITTAKTMSKIDGFPPISTKVVSLDAGMRHVLLVLDNGEVWGFGEGKKGQLGAGKGTIWSPVKVWAGEAEANGFRAQKVVCGKDFSLIAGESGIGMFKILGSDRHGLVSTQPESLRNWIDIQASWGSIYVLLRKGILTSWGRNDYGQLSTRTATSFSTIAAGSEHAVGLTVEGQILAWGWGEHGNCGSAESDSKKADKSILPVPAQDHDFTPREIAVGAGCATTWIILKR